MKIGDQRYPISYVVVRNLLTSVTLGKQTLNDLKAIIDCENGTLTVKKFGTSTRIKTHKIRKIDIPTVSNVVIKPHNFQYVPCRPASRLHYKGTLLSVMKKPYENSGVIWLIESANRLSISIPVINDSDSPKRLRANSCIAKLIPLSTDDDLFPLDIDDMYTLKCNAVKKKNPKPTFSRPICPENEGDSDEVIVRNCVEKYASHLSPVRKQQLVELILIYVEAFSIRGELGRTKSFKYELKIKQGA